MSFISPRGWERGENWSDLLRSIASGIVKGGEGGDRPPIVFKTIRKV